MELTPVRVRGRRKRDRPAELKESLQSRLRKVARFNHAGLKALKTTRPEESKLSRFEQLPTEIIQVIFEYCNTVGLPLSSPIFASQLSSTSIYVKFTADLLYAEDCGSSCQAGTAISRMLQCRWMSWKIFRAAVEQCHSRAEQAFLDIQAASSPGDEISDSNSNNDQDPPAPPIFDHPDQQETPRYLHLHSPIQIPEKLLRGPWTSDKTSFLYFLIWHNTTVDWNLSSRGETASSLGLVSAIESQNRRAVACLLSPAVGVVPSAAQIRSAIMEYGCDLTIVFHLLQAILRATIEGKEKGERSDVVTDFTFRDASIWRWAARLKNVENSNNGGGGGGGGSARKGEWLLDTLRYADDARIRNSRYDEVVHQDLVRACCARVEDGIEIVGVPLMLTTEGNQQEGEG